MTNIFTGTAALCLATALCASAQSYVHFEARHVHPIGLSPDGTRLFVLNSPDARLSVFDVSNAANPSPMLIAEIPVGLEPVSLRARTNDEVWVVNELSDSVSIVSVSGRKTVATLRTPDEPADVVFTSDRAFVSCARDNSVRVFDLATRMELAVLDTHTLYPRALAVNASGTRVYAASLLSGNGTTVLKQELAPPQPPPTNPALPPPPATALIVLATDNRIGYTVLDNDVAEIDTESLTVNGHFSGAGTNLFDLAVHPVTGDLWVANTEARNRIPFEPALRGHFEYNRITKIALPGGVFAAFDLNADVNYSLLPDPAALATALAQPTALSFAADGTHMWVAAFASDRVAKVLTNGTVAARVDLRPSGGSRVMRGPRGLAWQQNNQRLYVMNKLANSVSVVNTTTGTLLTEVPAGTHDPTPSAVKEGRGFLFDARLSGNGTMSCASCHLDADRDGLAWDLGDPGGEMVIVPGKNAAGGGTTLIDREMHPMKGPMTTQTLRGLQDGAPFHWRGDRPLLQSFNPTFNKLMGGAELITPDIDAMADYLNTLRHHPNPGEQLDRTPPQFFGNGNTTVGRTLFNQSNTHCAACHILPGTTGNNIDLMNLVSSTQPVKDPSIVLSYQKHFFFPQFGSETLTGFGMLHDGTGSSLPTVHPYSAPGLANVQQFADVKAFILTLDTGTAPAVGYDLTVTTANRTEQTVLNDLVTLEDQAMQLNCDLIVRGILQGRARSFRYYCNNAVCSYLSDRFSEPGITRAALLGMLTTGDALTWLGVPYGLGAHFGGDRDGDSILDADEPAPVPAVTSSAGTFSLQWPNTHTDWYFESGGSLQGPWSPLTLPRTTAGPLFSIQASAVPGQKAFYRLRRTW